MRNQSLGIVAVAWASLSGALLALTTASAAEPEPEQPRSRREFTAAMNKLDKGALVEDALRLLGPPDDIRTHSDPPGIGTTQIKEIWRYGTSGHMTTATLGQVYIDDRDQVQYLIGQGEPPPDDLMPEAELRSLLSALDKVPSYLSGSKFNPRLLIRAVNLLQPLGKEKSLAVIAEYLRVTSEHHDDGHKGMFLVLRTLFDVPETPGFMPPMLVGAALPRAPADQSLLPHFPLTIEQGMPLLVVAGYFLGGRAESPSNHLDIFRENDEFRIRKDLLVPTDQPFEALDAFTRSPRWSFTGDSDSADEILRMSREQVLRMIDTVYRVEPSAYGTLLPHKATADKILAEASQLRIRWDAREHKYVFLDGTSLPAPERTDYRIQFWRPNNSDYDLTLSIVRTSAHYASVGLLKHAPGRLYGAATATIRIRDAAKKRKAILTLRLNAGVHGDQFSNHPIELPAETEIQAELIVDGKSYLSPVLKP